MSLQHSPVRYLRRRDAATYLKDRWGLRCAEQTLANYATRGTGPEFRRYGRDVVYEVSKLDEYARSRLSAPVRSTSEDHLTVKRTE